MSLINRKRRVIGGDSEKLLNPEHSTEYNHREKLDAGVEEDEDLDDQKEDVSMVIPQFKDTNDVSSLWEIRIRNCLKDSEISNSNKVGDEVLLKNVLTGKFLYLEPNSEGLTLKSWNEKGTETKNFNFFVKMKNNWNTDNSLKYKLQDIIVSSR